MRGCGRASGRIVLLGTTMLGLAAGALLHLLGKRSAGQLAWAASTLIVLVPTIVDVLRGLLRREAGVDVIAVLAMAGALWLREYLAGAVIALMLTGGNALERLDRKSTRLNSSHVKISYA